MSCFKPNTSRSKVTLQQNHSNKASTSGTANSQCRCRFGRRDIILLSLITILPKSCDYPKTPQAKLTMSAAPLQAQQQRQYLSKKKKIQTQTHPYPTLGISRALPLSVISYMHNILAAYAQQPQPRKHPMQSAMQYHGAQ